MIVDIKSIRGAAFVGSVVVALVGFIISTTRGAVQVTQTLERVNTTQQEIMKANTEQHREFSERLTAGEVWRARREGYEARIAEEVAND